MDLLISIDTGLIMRMDLVTLLVNFGYIGLSKIHHLTKEGPNTLRVDLGDFEGNTAYANYSTFSVSDGSTEYILTVGGYSGTAGDSMTYHNGY